MSRRENGDRKDEEIAVMISRGLNTHMMNRPEPMRVLLVKGHCGLTVDIQTGGRNTDFTPYASSPGHPHHRCGPQVQNKGSAGRAEPVFAE